MIELPSDYQNEVTSVICRNINPGYEKDYDNWLKRFMALQRKAPGYLGVTIIIPGSNKSSMRYIIRRFTDNASMEKWDNSNEAVRLLEEVNNYSIRHYEHSTGSRIMTDIYFNVIFCDCVRVASLSIEPSKILPFMPLN